MLVLEIALGVALGLLVYQLIYHHWKAALTVVFDCLCFGILAYASYRLWTGHHEAVVDLSWLLLLIVGWSVIGWAVNNLVLKTFVASTGLSPFASACRRIGQIIGNAFYRMKANKKIRQ